MGYRYAVLGAGRQGTAAGYDLGRYGEADDLVIADVKRAQALRSAARINRLIGRRLARGVSTDVLKGRLLAATLDGVDVLVSAVPYVLNLRIARQAIDSKVSMVDLGGNTAIVKEQLRLDKAAREAGIAIVPDCGMGPGLNITLGVHAMGLLDIPRDVYIYDGGLPQAPEPPWDYALTFNVAGLTNEYAGAATFLREGRIVEVPALTEIEEVQVPPLGRLEAAVTTGGLSTAPWSFLGVLRTLQNKTLRYPGHWARMQAFRDLGLFRLDSIRVDGRPVVPRHVFHALFEPQVAARAHDVCVERIRAYGTKDDRPAEVSVDLVDWYDDSTGFTAMERLTGWHASIAAEMIARGQVERGAHPVELGLPAKPFVGEVRRRGIAIDERISFLDDQEGPGRGPEPLVVA